MTRAASVMDLAIFLAVAFILMGGCLGLAYKKIVPREKAASRWSCWGRQAAAMRSGSGLKLYAELALELT